jgi:sporulation protein YlmC with PRC-barrel domain
MDIPIGAEVYCSDGLAGHTSAVIIDPATRQVTHLVVRERALPFMEYLAPIELVSDATPREVHLRCSKAGLDALEPFHYSDYGANAADYAGYASDQYYFWPEAGNAMLMPTEDPMDLAVAYDHVPAGELAIDRGARVNARDGHVGKVDEFLVDPRDDKITHLVLREGHLWGKKAVTIPVTEIDHIDDNEVYLKLDKQAVETLPAVPLRGNNP